jgi:tRNA 2-selenouridine synthase
VNLPLRERKVGIDALSRHAERIDVRSPAEFALDHIPHAINCPVLGNEERARIGTMHTQISAFAAKRVGAALVARNIASMLETTFADKPRDWSPLVYCWRGGKRSEALTHILNEIGWSAAQLEGGYRTYRRHVVAQLDILPARFRFEVICGLTGTGKSRLISALATEGAQTLDLEALAKHRGSLLGDLPDAAQPSQKSFETGMYAVLAGFDPERPIYVEAESRRIGAVQLPDALLAAMRDGGCVRVDMPHSLRVALLKEEYAHLGADPAALSARLANLTELYGRKTIGQWAEAAATGDWDALIDDLLARHYDPMYAKSIARNFPNYSRAIPVAPAAIGEHAFRAVARKLDAEVRARCASSAPIAA